MFHRRSPLVNGEYYHVYNRGVARQPVFFRKGDYKRFLLAITYYLPQKTPLKLSAFLNLPKKDRQPLLEKLTEESDKLVSLISFVLMPNHFHLLLRQELDNGISTFLSKISNSYTKYLNVKHDRVGPLFQGVFKAVHIETDEQLLHVSRYIHLNPLVSHVVKESDFLSYPWSSLPDFLRGKSSLLNLEPVLSHFSSPENYRNFVFDQADYAKRLEVIQHLILES